MTPLVREPKSSNFGSCDSVSFSHDGRAHFFAVAVGNSECSSRRKETVIMDSIGSGQILKSLVDIVDICHNGIEENYNKWREDVPFMDGDKYLLRFSQPKRVACLEQLGGWECLFMSGCYCTALSCGNFEIFEFADPLTIVSVSSEHCRVMKKLYLQVIMKIKEEQDILQEFDLEGRDAVVSKYSSLENNEFLTYVMGLVNDRDVFDISSSRKNKRVRLEKPIMVKKKRKMIIKEERENLDGEIEYYSPPVIDELPPLTEEELLTIEERKRKKIEEIKDVKMNYGVDNFSVSLKKERNEKIKKMQEMWKRC